MKRSVHTAIELLDGGMGHLLRRKGVDISGPIGSQRRFLGVCLANIEQPDLVIQAHRDYINVGSTVITTNNYAVVPATIELSGEYTLEQITTAACIHASLAQRSHSGVRVAGSLPPLNESYRPDRVGAFDDMLEDYQRIAVALEPHVDYFLCETMSKIEEATAAVSACDIISTKDVHVAFTLAENTKAELRSGESIQDAAKEMLKYSNVSAILLNCTSLESINAALPKLRDACGSLRFGAYGNAFNTAHSDGKCSDYNEDITPEVYTAAVKGWIEEGATIVGGCCGIFPEHIAQVRAMIDSMELAA